MPTSEFVVENGELLRVVQTTVHAELEQVKSVVVEKQTQVDSIESQIESLTSQLTEAQAALADAKSDAENAERVVAESAAVNAGVNPDDDGAVAVDVTVANAAQEF